MSTWISVVVAIAFTFFALWQKKTWIYYIAGIAWIAMGIFNFVDFAYATRGWVFAWIYMAVGLVCITAGVWLREKGQPEEDGRDTRYKERQKMIDAKRKSSW